MGQALYRKYRSKKFSEVVGQEHITTTLEKAIKGGRISHAYLFSGPKGVGKTSVARILAHEVNQLPYGDDTTHLDIIEIDAASNRRIDEIRDLREKVHIAPTSSKYKVYIIDEVHMLTKEAFNALLKTLEEPPAHCIFILATTEAHKLPETIVSRTQRFSFKPIVGEEAQQHLKVISKKEKIDITQEALALLAVHGQGSFRDSISLLDQLSASRKRITEQDVRQFLGLPPLEAIEELTVALDEGDAQKILKSLEELKSRGSDAVMVAQQLGTTLRKRLIEGSSLDQRLARLLKDLLEIPASNAPYELLEISLLEAASKVPQSNNPRLKDIQPSSAKRIEAVQPTPRAEPKKPEAKSESGNFSLDNWDEVLQNVKHQAASMYTALRLATPKLDGQTLRLYFRFPLHQKKLSNARNLKILGDIIEKLYGSALRIECIVESARSQPKSSEINKPEVPENSGGNIQTISNIFGSAEVLES